MNFKKFVNSTIGLKILMALSGLVMVGFLCAHLSGNLLVFLGPEAINTYAKKLRDFLPILWIFRIGLILSALIHVITAIKLTIKNKAARAVPYQVKNFIKTSAPAKTMILSGLLLLSFILYHLAHFTFRWTHPNFETLDHYDVYSMMIESFSSPLLTGFYVISIILLGLHLNHGIQSVFQSLGIRNKSLEGLARMLSIFLCVGFLSIPLAVFTGFLT